MGTSVVRPLAVAHGGNSRQREVEEAHDPAKAEITDRERNDHLSVRCNKKRNDQLSEKNCTISCRFATNVVLLHGLHVTLLAELADFTMVVEDQPWTCFSLLHPPDIV